MKKYVQSVGMVINHEKCAIQLNDETPSQSLSRIPQELMKRLTSIWDMK